MDPSIIQKINANFIRITITGSYTETDMEGRFTMFLITVQSAFAKWEICRRYRHFQALHQDLMSRAPGLKLPTLPGKKKSIFGSSLDPSIVEERKVSLEAYLRQLIQLPQVWANQVFIEFLDHSQAFLGVQMHMTRMSNRISELESFLENMQLKYTASLRECQDAVTLVRQLAHRVTVLEQDRGSHLGSSGATTSVANSLPTLSGSFSAGSTGSYRHSAVNKGYLHSMYSALDENNITATIEDNFRRLSSEYSDRTSMSGQYPTFGESFTDNSRQVSTASQATSYLGDDATQYLMQQPIFQGYGLNHSSSMDRLNDPFSGALSHTANNGSITASANNSSNDRLATLSSAPVSRLSFNAEPTTNVLQQVNPFPIPGVPSNAPSVVPIGSSVSGITDDRANGNEDEEHSSGTSPQSPGYFVKQILCLDPQYVEDNSFLSRNSFNDISHEDNDTSREVVVGGTGSRSNSSNTSSSDWLSIVKSLGIPQSADSPLMSSVADQYGVETTSLLGTEQGSMWDHLVDEIVLMIQPQESQNCYRNSVVSFMSRQVRRTLGVHLFEIEMQGLRTFLPDDPVRLSIFVGKNDKESSWYVKLNERLCRLSGGVLGSVADADGKLLPNEHPLLEAVPDLSEVLVPLPYAKTHQHSLSNVSFLTNHDGSYKLQCLVDTALGVEVVANYRNELCMLMFFEEFDRLVGRNHLFKRSVLLIRAWWMYEANLSGTCVPDNAIVVMIVAIFNRHHLHLFYPMQVLYAFLIEYANVNFSSNVFTIYGPIPYEVFADIDVSVSGAMPAVPPPTCPLLLSAEIVSKYKCLSQAKDSYIFGLGEISSEEIAAELGAITGNSSNNNSNTAQSGNSASSTAANNNNSNTGNNGTSQLSRACFAVRPLMICHPFSATKINMIPDLPGTTSIPTTGGHNAAGGHSGVSPVAIKRATKIMQSIRNGAVALRKCIQSEIEFASNAKSTDSNVRHSNDDLYQTENNDGSSSTSFSYHESVESLFKTVMNRFGRGWRPDAHGDAASINKDSNPSSGGRESASHENLVGSGLLMSAPPGLENMGNGNHSHSSPLISSSSIQSAPGHDFSFIDESVDAFTVSLDKLQDRIKYANLLLEAQISESALRILSLEILAEKGSLPVGEIGKMLQEATAMNAMSAALKERFGGLKKFLESNADDFILSNDHPFNPHVYLKRPLLTSEEASSGLRGEYASQQGTASGSGSKGSAKGKKQKQPSSGRLSGSTVLVGGAGAGALLGSSSASSTGTLLNNTSSSGKKKLIPSANGVNSSNHSSGDAMGSSVSHHSVLGIDVPSGLSPKAQAFNPGMGMGMGMSGGYSNYGQQSSYGATHTSSGRAHSYSAAETGHSLLGTSNSSSKRHLSHANDSSGNNSRSSKGSPAFGGLAASASTAAGANGAIQHTNSSPYYAQHHSTNSSSSSSSTVATTSTPNTGALPSSASTSSSTASNNSVKHAPGMPDPRAPVFIPSGFGF